jgi:hypothetical protein
MVSPLLQQCDVPLSTGLHANEAVGRSSWTKSLGENSKNSFDALKFRAWSLRRVSYGLPLETLRTEMPSFDQIVLDGRKPDFWLCHGLLVRVL